MEETKRCPKCERVLPREASFQKNRSMSDGFEHWCRDCKSADYKGRRDKRKREGLCHCGKPRVPGRRTCAECQQRVRRWGVENPERKKKLQALWRKGIKDQVFEHYGKSCVCCNEIREEFLTIDHIFGGGTQHRKKLGLAGTPFYTWLIQQGFPEGYRTLCMNCNFAHGHFGYCPHDRERAPESKINSTT